jgi:ketosteroid isomerase-like protein
MPDSPNVAVVKEYFLRSDARRADVFDLLDDDIEFYFPKYGIGRGKREFARFGAVLARAMDVYHHQDGLRFIENGNHVVVEGTSYGSDASGRTWRGGETPGGRFCSVSEIRDGLITRHYIYADPDYTSVHTDGFLWGTDQQW